MKPCGSRLFTPTVLRGFIRKLILKLTSERQLSSEDIFSYMKLFMGGSVE